MDDSTRQFAVIAESIEGTTPSTPTFLLTRNVSVSGGLETPRGESDERSANGMVVGTWKMNQQLPKSVELRLNYDAGLHAIMESACWGAWTANVLKVGTIKKPLSAEEKWIDDSGGLVFRRSAGLVCGSLAFSIANNAMSRVSAAFIGMDETTATTAISGATYTAAGTGNIMVPADAVVNDIVGVSSPRMMTTDFTITNGARPRFAWASAKSFSAGRGRLRIAGRSSMYFDTVGQYTALKAMPTGVFDFTLGDVAGQKMRFVVPKCRISNVSIPDGTEGDSTLAFDWAGEFDPTENTIFKATRAI